MTGWAGSAPVGRCDGGRCSVQDFLWFRAGDADRARVNPTPETGVLYCDDNVARLAEMASESVAVAFHSGGTIMQYTGDEIFAVFGAPLPIANHAKAAIECARAMFAQLNALNLMLQQQDMPPINFGIGIHSGEVVAAHVGSSSRMQYSVIGDTVNVAGRHVVLPKQARS